MSIKNFANMKKLIKSFFQEIRFASHVGRMADGNRASRRKAKKLISERRRVNN